MTRSAAIVDSYWQRKRMKKILVLVVLLVGAYFGLKKWSPKTLDRIAFWKSAPAETAAPLPPAEPWASMPNTGSW